MNLELIINRIFVDNHENIHSLLKKYDIDKTIDKTIELIKRNTNGDSNELKIGTLVSAYLTNVNSKLRTIQSLEDKQNLEYIISDISRELIFTSLRNDSNSIQESINELVNSLKTTCEINDYDFDELKKFLHLDTIINTAKLSDSFKIKINSSPSYYEWLGQDYELDELGRNLASEKCISSVKTFKKLFAPHDGMLKVQSNPKHLDFLIVLFDVLKSKKKIKPKGQSGHFEPLSRYLVDPQNNLLINKAPKHIKYTIKKNKTKSSELYNKANKWIQI